MALINCPECGKQISNNAENCPNCGHPVNFKKNISSKQNKKVVVKSREGCFLQTLNIGCLIVVIIIILIILFILL